MRRLELDDVLLIASRVLDASVEAVRFQANLHLLDSALHAPFAGFGDVDVYPDLGMKAAVLASRIMRNHALPDGNKRTSFLAMWVFVELNGGTWRDELDVDEAISLFERCAAGEVSERELAAWVRSNASGT